MEAYTPTREGDIPFQLPGIAKPCFTHYKLFGDLSPTTPTVVFLHGGPGAGHGGLLPFSQLWPRYNLPCVFYDHIGCGLSTHLPETAGDEALWREELFLAELDNLLDHLALRAGAGFHLLGHSFGGNMSACFAARRPAGLRRLVLASAVASKALSVRGVEICKETFPSELRERLREAEAKDDFDGPAHKEALALLFKTYGCRADPYPPEFFESMRNLAEDKTVYTTVNGPNPLRLGVGSMRDWTSVPRLHLINVPTFIYNGEFDSSHDVAQMPFFENIPCVRWYTFPDGGHMSHMEPKRREKVLEMVGEFLTQSDDGGS